MPSPEFAQSSHLARYMGWLQDERQLSFSNYEALWRWSVNDLEAFWGSIWDYFQVECDSRYSSVCSSRAMPGTRWFEGSRLNYAEHLLRYEARLPGDQAVFHHSSEIRAPAVMSWSELGRQVRILATRLRELGVQPGDCVVSYMPNIPETAVAMIATTAIGAVWSSAAPEFGVRTVVDRFAQIEPKVLFAADGYRFGGKDFSREGEVRELVRELPTLQHVVWLPYLRPDASAPLESAWLGWADLMNYPGVSREAFRFERVPYDHPLWVVFSSGTTGQPKAIVHSHAGMLLEHLKLMHLHLNLKPESVMLFYSTTGWMMWNVLIGALLAGSAAVLYDGSPMYPGQDRLWRLAADTGATSFGASPMFVQLMEKAGLRPGELFDLNRLESVILSGAPSPPETFGWFYRNVKRDLWVTSQSGGTELCSAFVGAAPTQPVHAGEIQVRMLGMDVHAWSEDGREVIDEIGELVVTSPFPSMPLRFWNDADGARYREAYFERFPGVWRHGDFIKINQRGGCYIYGRSDSTLNRFGVRIGTAEIYRVVEQLPEIADSLIVCCEPPGEPAVMPLFVKLKPGHELDDELRRRIQAQLREDCSPRHVPDRIHAVAAIPYTLTGKKMEVPVQRILLGWPIEKVASRDAMMNPDALQSFENFRV